MSERQDGNLDRAAEIFDEARKLERDEREPFLAEVCAGNGKLRDEIESMLAARSRQGEFLGKPTVGLEPAAPSPASIGAGSEGPGSVIDRYRLLQHIGEGGFGVVYMAEQRKPIKRKVALKIIKLGMDTRQVIARFDAERQALAMMDHPGIARVLDAGATEAGRPYFVMELVKGVPITEYCDTQNLPTGERLDLFIDVCNAVQHAHQKGIIHRDIKPSNVLVTLHDGKPVPKVIDFGIAKATNAELTEKTLFTEFRQMVGTPTYMSPEQAEMSGLDLDTRSDIYSLGVLLYELLTGNTPFDTRRLCNVALDEIQRIIREEEPARPSAMVSGLSGPPEESKTSAEYVTRHRRTDLQTLVRRLRGDLDWMVMMALEKDRTRRYETAAAFAEDIRRHRTNQPVIARPPSTGYRVRKFVRRNRLPVTAAAMITIALVAGLTLATVGLVQAKRAQAGVVAEVERTRAVADFYAGVFFSVNPMGSSPGAPPATEVTLVDVLHSASEHVQEAFEGRPVLEAEVRKTLGRSFFGLGLMEQAVGQAERALALETEALGSEHPTTVRTGLQLGASHWIRGDYPEAERVIRPHIEKAIRVIGTDDPFVLRSMCLLTNTLANLGRIEEAEGLARDVVERTCAALGDNHPITIDAKVDLARCLLDRGRLDESEELLRGLIEGIESGELQAGPMTVLFAYGKLALVLAERGEHEEAGGFFDKTIAMGRRMLGENHPWFVGIRSSRGTLLYALGDLDEAERELRPILELQRASAGAEDARTLSTALKLLPVLIESGRFAEAEQLGQEVIDLSASETAVVAAKMYLGWALLERGEAREGERIVGAVLRDLEQRYPGGVIHLPTCRWIYGRTLAALERFDEAESQLQRAYESQNEMRGPGSRMTRLSALALHDLYRAWGKDEAAAEWEVLSAG